MSNPVAEGFDIDLVRKDFPILGREVNGKQLVYLDNAATTQKPRSVIEALTRYYTEENSNVHRGVHFLSQHATDLFEAAREKVKTFINAPHSRQVIFTRGTTEGINLIASTFGRQFIGEGDEILITGMEHHSNIVPWQMLAKEKKAILKVAEINDQGEVIMESFKSLLSPRTKLVSFCHVSNALGTINPAKEMIALAKKNGSTVLVDGAQAIGHLPVDVQDLNCDFYAFSAHKMYGPTGIGAIYGKEDILNKMDPYQGGGEMISTVSFEGTVFNEIPFKFEAGTPDISGVLGMAVAIDYIEKLGRENIFSYEDELRDYAHKVLSEIEGIRFIGTAKNKISVISFLIEGCHPYDIGVILDQQGIAIRTGHHCTQPLMERFGIPGTCRASFAMYNTKEEADKLAEAVRKAKRMLL